MIGALEALHGCRYLVISNALIVRCQYKLPSFYRGDIGELANVPDAKTIPQLGLPLRRYYVSRVSLRGRFSLGKGTLCQVPTYLLWRGIQFLGSLEYKDWDNVRTLPNNTSSE
jgi:hypothetical protein